jgi:hypothetical protein
MKRYRIVWFAVVCAGVVNMPAGSQAADKIASQSSAALMAPEQAKAAQAIISDTCNSCHANKKPLSAVLFKEHTPSRMAGHFKKKAELNEEQVKLMVQYLSAVRDGKADLPKAAPAKVQTESSAKSEKHGKHEQDEDEDEESDE